MTTENDIMKRLTHHTAFKFAIALTLVTLAIGTASSTPKLQGVSYDPAFISAGDRVDIAANLKEVDYPDKYWDEDKELKAVLKAGNKLTRDHVTIEEDRDESIGFLYPEGVWTQRYQVKIDSNAPTGMYEFEIHIQYLENGEPVQMETEDGDSNITTIRSFSMPVDNEGVDLTADVVKTSPRTPRTGNNYVEIDYRLTNTGNKPVQEVEMMPSTPEYIDTSYSQDEKFFVGRLNEGESVQKTLTVDLEDSLQPGLQLIDIKTTYEDTDSNPYSEQLQLPLRVEGRPDLEIVDKKLEMKAGATSELRLDVENTGEQDAESVTARVIAERTQPFSLEDRSDYVGEIEAGETGEAVLKISSDREASLKTHQLKVQLRASGDSEEGDSSVYTFTEDTKVELTDRSRSPLVSGGIVAALLVLSGALYRYRNHFRGEDSES